MIRPSDADLSHLHVQARELKATVHQMFAQHPELWPWMVPIMVGTAATVTGVKLFADHLRTVEPRQ